VNRIEDLATTKEVLITGVCRRPGRVTYTSTDGEIKGYNSYDSTKHKNIHREMIMTLIYINNQPHSLYHKTFSEPIQLFPLPNTLSQSHKQKI
jgi:hypothetical protein